MDKPPMLNGLDRFLRPVVSLGGYVLPAFQLCGYTGLALAIALTQALVRASGLSPWVMTAITLAAVATFFTLAMVTKIIVGEETLIYYHHEIAVLAVTALLLRVLGQPVLPYLDITILGIGAFLVCGRMGCLMAGCCHGRPHAWGVCYRAEHADAGLNIHLVGARLFPTQLIESLLALVIVVVGSALLIGGTSAGTALAWYIIAYDIGRFCLEFMRGDTGRPYYWRFSEAQWIALGLTMVVVVAELAGALPWYSWHLGAALGLALLMAAVAVRRTRRSTYQLFHPNHIRELAAGLDLVALLEDQHEPAAPSDIHIARTYLGIQVSASRIDGASRPMYHYTLSAQDGRMTDQTARLLAGLITALKHPSGQPEFVKRGQGIFHILIHPSI